MSEMVERVARAIDPEAWADDIPVPTRSDTVGFHLRRQDSARLALTAIAAMRDPTEAMTSAGEEARRLATTVYFDGSEVADGDMFEHVYRAAIDAALAPEPKP